MFNDSNSPLLFINSVQSTNTTNQNNNQKVFDSRMPREKKEEQVIEKRIILADNEMIKLKNICTLYHNKRPVLCEITCMNQVIEGVPIRLDEVMLYIMVDGKEEEIPLTEIKGYIILDL